MPSPDSIIILSRQDLNRTLTQRVDRDFLFRLYGNDIDPAPDTPLSNFTEATFNGYAPQPVTTGAWSEPALYTGSTQGSIVFAATAIVWQSLGDTSPQLVYGVYVTWNDPDSALAWSWRFGNGPFDMIQAFSTISVLPQLSEIPIQ